MLLILSSIRLLVFGSNQDVEPKLRQEGGDERTAVIRGLAFWLPHGCAPWMCVRVCDISLKHGVRTAKHDTAGT